MRITPRKRQARYRGTSENTWANNQRSQVIQNYSKFASKRFTATASTDRYVYVLTEVQAGKEKGAGIVGVDMNSGKSDRQVLFKDKEPEYKVDEWTGRVFNVKDKKELTAYGLK